MGRTTTLVAAIGLLLAAFLVTSASSPGKEAPKAKPPGYTVATYGCPVGRDCISGTVFANKTKAQISRHGLDPNTSYQVAASGNPCSVADAAGSLVWRAGVNPGPADDVFAIVSIKIENEGKFTYQKIESLRIYRRADDGAISQEGCAKSIIFHEYGHGGV
jgi:hypothetical protein